MISKAEFELLKLLKCNLEVGSQRDLATKLAISLGKVNSLLKDLKEKELIIYDDGKLVISKGGEEALKPYKVDNAIIMAAGMSSRFAPLSYEKPKGLLKVKGEILIEREIEQLHEAGIYDITVVVGYMKEKFFYLEDKYDVKIVINEEYYKYNNTSTLIRVLDKLSNTYICSSDNYFVKNVFEPYVYQAYYAAVYAAGETEEYCMDYKPNGRISNVTIGGANSWYMIGHVYFDASFSTKFGNILQREYPKQETKEHLWENLYMKYIKELDLYIRKYDSDTIYEFDSLEELREFDADYINNADSSILKNIAGVLKCEIKDIIDIKAIKAGLTNTSFQFVVNGENYVYRHPGRGTEKYINRKSEAFSMDIAAKFRLDNTYIYMDENSGWKLSKYITNARELDYHNSKEVSKALEMMRTLHELNIRSEYSFGVWNKTEEFVNQLKELGSFYDDNFEELHNLMISVKNQVIDDEYSKLCLCHNDCYSPNFILDDEDNMFLIDWEYSGNDDPASDLGTFICCSDYSYEEAVEIIKQYLQDENPVDAQLKHYLGYVAIASYYWYVWALFQESRGNSVGEWLYIWYKNSKRFANEMKKL